MDRHLPAIATALAIVWLAAVCLYSIAGTPAAARRLAPKKLVKTALAGSEPSRTLEARSRPVVADVRYAPPPEADITPASDRPRAGRSESKKKRTDEKEPAPAERDLGHTPPVPPRLASEEDLKEPHHDYPALDLALDSGTKVVAVTSGRVKATTKWGACGKGVILRGRDNFTYTYCHGSKLLVGRGRSVDAGQGVMRSGNTGDSTGPHLHLQIRRPNGKLVCPQDLLPAWQEGVPKSPWEAGRTGCHTGGHKHKYKKGRR